KENKEKDKEKKEDTPVAPTPKKEARRASTIKAIVPEPPKPPPVPCAVCLQTDPAGTQKLTCRECKLTVHRACYGVREIRGANKWLCDMCANDKNPQSSTVSFLFEFNKFISNFLIVIYVCSMSRQRPRGRGHGNRGS